MGRQAMAKTYKTGVFSNNWMKLIPIVSKWYGNEVVEIQLVRYESIWKYK